MLKPIFLVCSWIGDGISQIKLTKLAVSEVHACCPPKYVYGHLDLSVDCERRG